MGNPNALLALAAGFGGGYLTGKQRLDEKQRQDRLDAQRTELHDAQMDEIKQAKQLRLDQADAVAPRTADDGTVVGGAGFYKDQAQAQAGQDMVQNIDSMGADPAQQEQLQAESQMRAEAPGPKPISLGDARPGYGVTAGSKSQITTDKPDLTGQNTTDAKMSRLVEATMKHDPGKALSLSNAVLDNKTKIFDTAQKMKQAGAFDSAQALRAGDAEGMFKASKTGYGPEMVALPKVTERMRTFPGINEPIKTFDAEFQLRHPDGTVTDEKRNSLDVMMQILPFEKALTVQQKGTNIDNTDAMRMDLNDIRRTLAGAAVTKANAAAKNAETNSGAGKIQKTMVDGKGYMVGVFRDGTSRRLTDADGDPIRSDGFEKRVDAFAKQLKETSKDHRKLPYSEVRRAAAEILANNSGSPPPQATAAPAGGQPNYSNLWK